MNSLLQRANCGDSHAQFKIAEAAYQGGDYETAHNWFLKAAQAGQLQAQTNIGVLYSRGEGCELDMAQSNRWLRKAALRGEPNAIGYLANHLLDALASNPDAAGEEPSAEALECAKWMRTAAEQNRAESVTRLGLLYWQGYGVKQDEAKALSLYEKGVRMGADPNGVDFASRPIRLRQLLSSDKAVNFDAFTTLKARLLLERDSS